MGGATRRRTVTACIQLVAYSNCAVNPVIYCLLNERFKARLGKLAAKFKSPCRGGPCSARRDDLGHRRSADSSRLAAKPPLKPHALPINGDGAMWAAADVPRPTTTVHACSATATDKHTASVRTTVTLLEQHLSEILTQTN